jgi:hypothetical protein
VRKEVALNDLINAETTCFDVGNRRWCEWREHDHRCTCGHRHPRSRRIISSKSVRLCSSGVPGAAPAIVLSWSWVIQKKLKPGVL